MRSLTLRDLLSLRTFGAPALSADGRLLALVERRVHAEENRNEERLALLRLPADGPTGPPVVLTRGASDHRPAFAPDGETLYFLARRRGTAEVWRLSLSGGEPEPVAHVDGGIVDYAVDPTGRHLALLARLGPEGLAKAGAEAEPRSLWRRYTSDVRVIERLFYRLDGEGFFGDRRTHLVLLDLATGALRLAAGGPYDYAWPRFSPDGAIVAVLSNQTPDPDRNPRVRQLVLVPVDGGPPTVIGDEGTGMEAVEWLPDGSGLVALASRPEHLGYGNAALHLVDRQGTVAPLTEFLDRPVGDRSLGDVPIPPGASFSVLDADHVAFLLSREGRVELWRVAVHGRELTRLAGGERVITGLAAASGRIAFAWTDPVTPSALSLLDAASGSEQVLYDGPAFDEPIHLVPPRAFQVRSRDGTPVAAWYLPPAAPSPGRVPSVLEVHGGPMAMYAWRFMFEFQLLAAHGYGVVYGNPRGSLGYGHQFAAAIIGDWGRKDYEDLLAIADGALANFPELRDAPMGIAGGSYGGFLVNWAIGHTDRFRAAVTMRSVVNRLSAMGTADLGYDRVAQYGPNWWEDPTPYLRQSPLLFASQIRTPLLIEHQEDDLRLPIEQAEQLYAALKLQGREVLFVRYPGESHGMSRTGRPWHRVHRLAMLLYWFDRHLRGRAVPRPDPRVEPW